jgi:hypothetical protein
MVRWRPGLGSASVGRISAAPCANANRPRGFIAVAVSRACIGRFGTDRVLGGCAAFGGAPEDGNKRHPPAGLRRDMVFRLCAPRLLYPADRSMGGADPANSLERR